MASLGVKGPLSADAGHGFVRRYLSQQVRQHGGITHTDVYHLDGPYLQGLGIDAHMSLRHYLRYSAPCFLRFHLPSPRNLTPVLSTSKSKAATLRLYGSWVCSGCWRRLSVL